METSSDKQKILLCGRINDRFKQRNFLWIEVLKFYDLLSIQKLQM
jgi:hypothetical protein